jgi:hypothetical protein
VCRTIKTAHRREETEEMNKVQVAKNGKYILFRHMTYKGYNLEVQYGNSPFSYDLMWVNVVDKEVHDVSALTQGNNDEFYSRIPDYVWDRARKIAQQLIDNPPADMAENPY